MRGRGTAPLARKPFGKGSLGLAPLFLAVLQARSRDGLAPPLQQKRAQRTQALQRIFSRAVRHDLRGKAARGSIDRARCA